MISVIKTKVNMRILLAQMNPTIGDVNGNVDKISKVISIAKAKNTDLIIFPEMALIGYPPEDFLLLPHFIDDFDKALQRIVRESKGLSLILGTVRRHGKVGEKPLCNSAAVIENGRLLGFADKMLLPTYDVFDERRFFEPGKVAQVFTICGYKIAITICEDIWQHSQLLKYSSYERDPVRELSSKGPDIAVNLSASPFSMRVDQSHQQTRFLACMRAVSTLKCPLFLCNQVGANDSLIFDGHSAVFDKDGKVRFQAKGFEEDNVFIDYPFDPHVEHFKPNVSDPIAELYSALVLGVRDYFAKSGFKKACIGLSGGIDSAIVAAIAVQALDKDHVLGVIMPSRYSSEHSQTDALDLKLRLGIKTQNIPIDGAFQGFLDLLSHSFEGMPANVTEENIQARIRGLILMALSNKFGYIVLSTGNKSELAMGYATLYGDMCGGLAVINDVTKQQVYQLSKWINREKEVIPWNIIHKEPSAELAPNQKDSDSLPDYSIVDNVLTAYIENHEAPEEIAARFGLAQELVDDLIKRIHINEFKRRQSAPGLRVSSCAFSVGRRFPIVQKYV